MADCVAVWHPTFVYGGSDRSAYALVLYDDGSLRLESPVPNGEGEVFVAPDALRTVLEKLNAPKPAESIPVTLDGFDGNNGGSSG